MPKSQRQAVKLKPQRKPWQQAWSKTLHRHGHVVGVLSKRPSLELTLLCHSSHNHSLHRHLLFKLPKAFCVLMTAINLNVKSCSTPATLLHLKVRLGLGHSLHGRAAKVVSVLGGIKYSVTAL